MLFKSDPIARAEKRAKNALNLFHLVKTELENANADLEKVHAHATAAVRHHTVRAATATGAQVSNNRVIEKLSDLLGV